MPKKILLATGGTGGHIYPAIGLAQQFAKENAEVLFIGGGLAQNRYFDQQAFPFHSVACGTFAGKSPIPLFRACGKILKGIWESRMVIRNFKPDVIVGFGSYYSFPPLVAARFQSVPIILHEANSIPGKVNKLLAPYALATGVHFPHTLSLLKGHACEVGMPLRKQFRNGGIDRVEARNYFGLSHDSQVLLVFGGSQGARILNTCVVEALKSLDLPSIEVIHIAGEQEQASLLAKAYSNLGIKACVKVFEERMEMAWQASDCVISRAGASSIAEQLEFEVPGILVPFARAADNHQNHNADFLADIVKGAKKLQEHALDPIEEGTSLKQQLKELLTKDKGLLDGMKCAMREYKYKRRIRDLYSLINELVFSEKDGKHV